MRTPTALPNGTPVRFAVADAGALGISPRRLRAGDLEIPYRGIRIRGNPPAEFPGLPEARWLSAAKAWKYAPRLKTWQFFSHELALALQGAPTPEGGEVLLHVSSHRPAREPRIPGIVGHRLQTRDPAWTVTAAGFRVENAVRAWRQAGVLWALDDLIAAADFLVLPRREGTLATIDELAAEVALMGDVADGRLTRALNEVRVGAESARETRLRLLLTRAGLPEPVLQYRLRDAHGREIARLDTAYPEYRLAFEYDGRQHADPEQFATDADRWERIRKAGWTQIRFLKHHMRGRRPRALEMARDALRDAGWSG